MIYNKKILFIFYTICWAVLAVSLLVSYLVGVSGIPILDALTLNASKLSNAQLTILMNLRLPRTIIAATAGMCLGVVGAVFQGLFQNPLAEPYVLGISSGASLGATIAIVLGLNGVMFIFSGVALFAAVGAIGTVLIVLAVAGMKGNRNTTVLLTGISISYFAASISTVITVLNADKIRTVTLWSMGSFTSSTWDKVIALVPLSLVGLVVIFIFLRELNAIAAGEKQARGLGVSVGTVRIILILTSTIMVGLSVAASGIIGFVGLIVPNGLRRVLGADFRRVVPASALVGAIFLVWCDTIARVLFAPSEIPAGVVTALIGTPCFVYLAVKGRGRRVSH